jgi:hypothetical protein
MVGMSDVGDMALVAVVGSSSTCPWVCLGLFVAVKLKLRWRVPVAYDDWWQVVRSAIFCGARLAWFSFVVIPQIQSCIVLSQVVKFWRGSSCGSAWPLQCWLVRRLCLVKSESFALSLWVGDVASRWEVMTMTPVRCLDEALFVEVWVEFLMCAVQRFCDGFHPVFH